MGVSTLNLGYREWGIQPTVLKTLEQEFKIDFLCANIGLKDAEKTLFKPYVIKEIQANSRQRKLPFKKLTIAMVGLTDNQLAQPFVNHQGEPELEYRDPIEAAKEIMPKIAKKADLVILLYYGKFQNLKTLLTAVPGFDVAIMGGENYLVSTQSSPTETIPIASTPSMGKYAGILTLQLDKQRRIVNSSGRQVPLKEDMAEDVRFNDLSAEFEKESKKPIP